MGPADTLIAAIRAEYSVELGDQPDTYLVNADWYPRGCSTRLRLPSEAVTRFLSELTRTGAAESADTAIGLVVTYVEEEIEAAGAADTRVREMGLRTGAGGSPEWFAEREDASAPA